METEPAIVIDHVSRRFAESGGVLALDDVSFTVGQGEIVGLLGSNGAGKTTLTKILSTLLLPTSGTARVLGADVVRDAPAVRACQSVVLGGDKGLYGQLNARENLRFFGMLDGIPHRELMSRLDGALEEVGLAEASRRRVRTFSKGMRQRLHLAIGLISRPRVLLLDEPTVGLDPVEAARLRASIAGLREKGISALLTSHYLTDIEELADRIVMLDHGRVTHDMTVKEFSASLGYTARVTVHGAGPVPRAGCFERMDAATVTMEDEPGGWRAVLLLPRWSPEVFTGLGAALGDSQITDVEVKPARLEDVFIHLQSAGAAR